MIARISFGCLQEKVQLSIGQIENCYWKNAELCSFHRQEKEQSEVGFVGFVGSSADNRSSRSHLAVSVM